MAPFMIIGRWIRNRFGWPSLRLVADASACSRLQTCTNNCPMSLDVNAMVQIEQNGTRRVHPVRHLRG